jgi:hypothetical protein
MSANMFGKRLDNLRAEGVLCARVKVRMSTAWT